LEFVMPIDTASIESQRSHYKLEKLFNRDIPYYLLTFDKSGKLTSPFAANDLVSRLDSKEFDRVILYSHGWNTVSNEAIGQYDNCLQRLTEVANANHIDPGFSNRFVFIGILWPSTSLTWGNEATPDIASHDTTNSHAYSNDLVSDWASSDADSFQTILASAQGISESDAKKLADLAIDNDFNDEGDESESAENLMSAFDSNPQATASNDGYDGFGNFQTNDPTELAPAGLKFLDPRWIVRVLTFRKYRRRAGVIGRALASTLEKILSVESVKTTLVGHSYGCKVVLSAASKVSVATNKANGIVLYQPAVSNQSFSADLGDGRQGAYRPALQRSDTPIRFTYSEHDFALHKLFHRLMSDKADIGELDVGAISPYAALGGYPPHGNLAEVQVLDLPSPPQNYPVFAPSVALVGLNGTNADVTGHGDITGDPAIWALLTLF
jgi:hypothetical protein